MQLKNILKPIDEFYKSVTITYFWHILNNKTKFALLP